MEYYGTFLVYIIYMSMKNNRTFYNTLMKNDYAEGDLYEIDVSNTAKFDDSSYTVTTSDGYTVTTSDSYTVATSIGSGSTFTHNLAGKPYTAEIMSKNINFGDNENPTMVVRSSDGIIDVNRADKVIIHTESGDEVRLSDLMEQHDSLILEVRRLRDELRKILNRIS